MMYVLTKEGKLYLEKGLPEKRLVELLESGPIDFEEAKNSVENFPIALMWCKKNGWVEIKEGKIYLKKKPESFPIQEALEKVSANKPVDEKLLKILLKRKLVKKIVKGKADKLIGKEITQIPPELLKTGLWRKVKLKPYSLEASVQLYPGRIHPYVQIINEVRKFLLGLGFVEVSGPLVEMNFWNCDVLFMPSDHPARDIHDIFTVEGTGKIKDKDLWRRVELEHKKGWGYWNKSLSKQLILRSQGTAVSARCLYKLKPPAKIFTIAKVFRPDVIDAKHFIEFEQCEGIVAAKGLNFRHLLGYLKEISKIFGAKKVKFKPAYFPFTEPSVEMYNYIEGFGWVETGGAGIFRPEVTEPFGIDVPVLAWGLGLGRLAMIKLGIDDIRMLYTKQLKLLRKAKVV